jgi:hypothetical protein
MVLTVRFALVLRSYKLIYCLLVCLLLCVSPSFGKTPANDTTRSAPLRIDKETEQDVFSNDAYKAGSRADRSENIGFLNWLLGKLFGKLDPKTLDVIGAIIYYGLIALFIVGVVYVIIKMSGGKLFRGQSTKASVFMDISEDIGSVDVDALIRDAIEAEDYRLAFRYSYLKSLQLMNTLQLIDWKPYKTNYEYYLEFKQLSARPLFKDLYTGFEYVWYGDAPLSKEIFEKYGTEFNDFNRQLNV